MRVLLTTYLLRSGVLSHVWDLVTHLHKYGVAVSVGIKRSPGWQALLGPVKSVPHIIFDTDAELAYFAARERVTVVHAHSRLVFASSLAASRQLFVPLVLTLHGVYPWQASYPRELAAAGKIIAVGPAQSLGTENFTDKVCIIPNGIDTGRFKPCLPFAAAKNGPLGIVWFGRAHGACARGVFELGKAVSILRKKGMEIDARLIGQASGAAGGEFKMLGWVDDPISHLQRSHIAFGHGRALREAMACGNAGFLLAHGYGGLVSGDWFVRANPAPLSAVPEYGLPEPDARVIARDIYTLCQNQEGLETARGEARRTAEMYFDLWPMLEKITSVYNSLN